MWIFTPRGFVSVVVDSDDKTRFLVRSRDKEALQHMLGMFPTDTNLQHTPTADYPFRVSIDKEAFKRVLACWADQIDYHNFKEAARQTVGSSHPYIRVLMDVWESGSWYFRSKKGGEHGNPKPKNRHL